jgi:tetratricopeptide (TPR) repeat protein
MSKVDEVLDQGIQAFNRGGFAASIPLFTEALRRDPKSTNALFFRSLAQQMVGDEAAAIADLRQALAIAPRSATLVLQAARQLKQWGRVDEALVECRRAAKLAPRSSAVHVLRAELELLRGRPTPAWKAMQKAVSLEPRSGELRLQAALLLKSMGRTAEALKAAGEAIKRGHSSSALLSLKAELEAGLGRAKTAAATLEVALRQDPRSAALRLQAATLAKDRSRETEALEHCRRAVRLMPRSALVHMLKAELEFEVCLPDRAEKSLRKAIHLDPDSHELRLRVSALHARNGHFAFAYDELRWATGLAPDSIEVQTAHARMALWHGDYRFAEEGATKAMDLDSLAVEPLRIRGVAAALRGRLDEGLQYVRRAEAAGLKDAETYCWIAELLRLKGDKTGALRAIEKSLALWSTHLGAIANKCVLLDGKISAFEFNEMTAVIPPALYPMREADYRDDPQRLAQATADVLTSSMRGNRSLMPTFWYQGALREHIHYFPRGVLQNLQARLRFGRADRVFKVFARLQRAQPDEAYIYSHRGETRVWCGRIASARRDFMRAGKENDYLLWPKVGLTACAILQDRFAEAHKRLRYCEERGGSRSILLPWRVELCFREKDYKGALAFLKRDFDEPLPLRTPLWVTKALCLSRLGDVKGRKRIYRDLKKYAPTFMRDMEREAGKSQDAVLVQARKAFRGNRSRWLNTYFRKDGTLKIVRFAGFDAVNLPQQLRGQRWILEEA